eukprot:5731907-Amphidinium_carterae.1
MKHTPLLQMYGLVLLWLCGLPQLWAIVRAGGALPPMATDVQDHWTNATHSSFADNGFHQQVNMEMKLCQNLGDSVANETGVLLVRSIGPNRWPKGLVVVYVDIHGWLAKVLLVPRT